MISIDFFNSDSFKKILMCLSGLAIKLQEGEYDAEPPSKTVSTFFYYNNQFPIYSESMQKTVSGNVYPATGCTPFIGLPPIFC